MGEGSGGEARHGMGEGKVGGGMGRWELSAQIINDTKQEIQNSVWDRGEFYRSEAMVLQPYVCQLVISRRSHSLSLFENQKMQTQEPEGGHFTLKP